MICARSCENVMHSGILTNGRNDILRLWRGRFICKVVSWTHHRVPLLSCIDTVDLRNFDHLSSTGHCSSSFLFARAPSWLNVFCDCFARASSRAGLWFMPQHLNKRCHPSHKLNACIRLVSLLCTPIQHKTTQLRFWGVGNPLHWLGYTYNTFSLVCS